MGCKGYFISQKITQAEKGEKKKSKVHKKKGRVPALRSYWEGRPPRRTGFLGENFRTLVVGRIKMGAEVRKEKPGAHKNLWCPRQRRGCLSNP